MPPSACVPASRWSTRRPPSSPPRRRTSTRPTPRPVRRPRLRPSRRRHRWSSARARFASARGSSSTTARSRPPTRCAGWAAGAIMINSNPETVSTDFDASSRLYFESLDAESVIEVFRAEAHRRRGARRVHPVRRPDAARPGRATRRRRHPAARPRPRRDRPDRGADAFRRAGRAARHPPAAGRHGLVRRRGVRRRRTRSATRSSSGRRSSSAAWPSTSRTARRTWPRIIARAVAVDDERPVRIDAYLEGLELDVDAITDGADVLIPGLMEHVETRRRPLGRLDRRLPAAAHLARPTSSSSWTPSPASRWRSACAA